MQRSAIVFLILLRLAVGWHFLFEGIQKVHSTRVGPTTTNRPFSSAGYFREAPGPLGWGWRWTMGDPDKEALARLEVKPRDEDADPATEKPQTRMPPGLEQDWDNYLARFTKYYDLDDTQEEQARVKLEQAEAKVVDFLTYVPPTNPDDQAKDTKYVLLTSEQTLTFPSGEVKRRMGMKERIENYKAKLKSVREASEKIRALGKDVEGARLRVAKADVARARTGLLTDLDKQTQEMKDSLAAVLTPEQKEMKPLPEPEGSRLVWWLDFLTRWGLVVVGACLMVGLCTRLNAWLAAGFLLLTYLAVPAIPWLPGPPMSEGNYVFVNKNLVEFFALCVLATTYSGRWFGIDRLLHVGRCWITGKQPQTIPVAATAPGVDTPPPGSRG